MDNPTKPSELSELATTIQELAGCGKTIEKAIEEAEHRIKVLRAVKKMLDADKEPAPRTTKKKPDAPAKKDAA